MDKVTDLGSDSKGGIMTKRERLKVIKKLAKNGNNGKAENLAKKAKVQCKYCRGERELGDGFCPNCKKTTTLSKEELRRAGLPIAGGSDFLPMRINSSTRIGTVGRYMR